MPTADSRQRIADSRQPTAFVIPEERNLEVEKARLDGLVKRFAEAGPAGLNPEPHPFFGKMTVEEWGVLSYQHLDHRLRQFGV